jgi:hypothetical protein
MNREEGVSIAGTPSSFSLKNIGLSTIDLDLAISFVMYCFNKD